MVEVGLRSCVRESASHRHASYPRVNRIINSAGLEGPGASLADPSGSQEQRFCLFEIQNHAYGWRRKVSDVSPRKPANGRRVGEIRKTQILRSQTYSHWQVSPSMELGRASTNYQRFERRNELGWSSTLSAPGAGSDRVTPFDNCRDASRNDRVLAGVWQEPVDVRRPCSIGSLVRAELDSMA